MTRKELQELGYTEEQVNQLMDLNGKAINKANSERDEFAQKNIDLQAELAKREEDFKSLQDNAKVDEELQAKFDNLSNEYSEYQSKATERENEIKVNSALGIALAKSGTIDEVSLKANLNLEGLELTEGGELKGIDEQIKALKESKAYLFGKTTDDGLEHRKQIQTKLTDEDKLRKAMGLK